MNARRAPGGLARAMVRTSLAISESTGGRPFDVVATSSSRTREAPRCSESRLRLNDMEALRATVPTTARATCRTRGRETDPSPLERGGAGRAAVAAPGSQERGRGAFSAARRVPSRASTRTLLRRLA